MLQPKDFYFPPKVLALLVTIVVVGLTVFLVNKFVYGSVTIQSNIPGTGVLQENDTFQYLTPVTYRLKPGTYTFSVGSVGYLTKTLPVTVFPFWHRHVTVSLERDLSVETDDFTITYDYRKQEYLIAPQVTVPPMAPISDAFTTDWATYNKNAQEALSYIRKLGVDPHSLRLTWWGEDEWPAGKKIEY